MHMLASDPRTVASRIYHALDERVAEMTCRQDRHTSTALLHALVLTEPAEGHLAEILVRSLSIRALQPMMHRQVQHDALGSMHAWSFARLAGLHFTRNRQQLVSMLQRTNGLQEVDGLMAYTLISSSSRAHVWPPT